MKIIEIGRVLFLNVYLSSRLLVVKLIMFVYSRFCAPFDRNRSVLKTGERIQRVLIDRKDQISIHQIIQTNDYQFICTAISLSSYHHINKSYWLTVFTILSAIL